MSFLIFIIFGAIVGWITSLILKTDSNQGLLGDIILGILGSMFGGWIMNMLGQSAVNGFNLYSIFVGVIGSILLVVIVRKIREVM